MEFEPTQTNQELLKDIGIELESVARKLVYLIELKNIIEARDEQ